MPESLTFGLFSLNTGACSYPATAARIAQAAEAAGFDSLWAREGVHRLILAPPRHASASELEAFVQNVGTTLIGQI